MKVYCASCTINSTELPDDAALSPKFRFTCKNCTQGSSMLNGMTQDEILKSKLARRVASGLQLLPSRHDRTAERVQKWRAGNKFWIRTYKMLRRAGVVEITKAAAAEFTEKWLTRIESIGSGCSFCGAECEPGSVQFWRDPAGNPLDPLSYWPVCGGTCAGRKRAEVRWKAA
jgi:hypothetical protein